MGIARKQRAAAAGVEYFPCAVPPKGYTAADGTTMAVATVRPSFVVNLYCGDAENATADHGYRCDNADGTGRNIAGAYIKKPDMRAEWVRGWDNGRGVDVGRKLHKWANGQMPSHIHGIWGDINTDSDNTGGGAFPTLTQQGREDTVYTDPAGGNGNGGENAVRGVAMLACLRL